jgi:putative transposase
MMERICSLIKDESQKSLQRFSASNRCIKLILIMAKIVISYKFRILNPSKTVQERLEQTLRHCKDLYNAALQERRDAYRINRVSINYQAQQNQLPEIKQTNPEYKNIHSQVCHDVLKRVEKAFDGFFRRLKAKQKAGFPRFKGANFFDSFRYPQSGFSLTGDKLTLSKIGKVKIKLSRPVVGKVKTCTIKQECRKWFAISTVETMSEPLPKTGAFIGIDAGITSFLTLSDGSQIENNRFYQAAQQSSRVGQRSVSRKKRGGNNRKKAILKLRKIHQRVKNCRADFQHKISTYLVKTYDLIVVEKLNLSGMVRSKFGKSLNDAAIGNFYNMLNWKAERAAKTVVEVPAHFTSQTCHACGHCEKANRKTQADFECVKCHFSLNADLNAAQNILRLGKSALGLKWNKGSRLPKESPSITASV